MLDFHLKTPVTFLNERRAVWFVFCFYAKYLELRVVYAENAGEGAGHKNEVLGALANEKNLRRLSTSEAREIGSKGGKKSGEARRLKKASRERMISLLNASVSEADLKRLLKRYNKESIDESMHDLLIASMVMNAIQKGDARLYKLILDVAGESSENEDVGELERLIEGLKDE